MFSILKQVNTQYKVTKDIKKSSPVGSMPAFKVVDSRHRNNELGVVGKNVFAADIKVPFGCHSQFQTCANIASQSKIRRIRNGFVPGDYQGLIFRCQVGSIYPTKGHGFHGSLLEKGVLKVHISMEHMVS